MKMKTPSINIFLTASRLISSRRPCRLASRNLQQIYWAFRTSEPYVYLEVENSPKLKQVWIVKDSEPHRMSEPYQVPYGHTVEPPSKQSDEWLDSFKDSL